MHDQRRGAVWAGPGFDAAGAGTTRASARAVRGVPLGGMTIPTGGFATHVHEAIDGVQWALSAGAGIRVRLGPIGGGREARFREIPVDGARTFFDHVTAIPVSFSRIC